MNKIVLIIIAAVLLITALPGCSHPENTETIAAPAYAGPIAETMLQALNAGDYQSYCLAFNETMKLATVEEMFTETRNFIQNKIGTYKSKKVSEVKVDGANTTVIYTAKFSNALEDVKVNIVFQGAAENVTVSAFWLESPKLWEH